MKELEKFLQKEKQKQYLEIFMVLDEIAKKEYIEEFYYINDILMVKTDNKIMYRITFKKEVNNNGEIRT